jgi:trk system potassium uptake protein TrkA
MKIVIVGCGRVGSTLAENLDADGHEVIIFDVRTSAFDRLPETFKGAAIRGDGTDEGVLRKGGADGADVFLTLTEGDNRNVMAAQLAQESLGIPRVIAKVNDPVRAAAYAELGIVTLCRTNIMVDSIARHLGIPMVTGPGIDVPENGHAHPHTIRRTSARRVEEDQEAGAEPATSSEPGGPDRPVASDRPPVRPVNSRQATSAMREADAAHGQRLGFLRRRG